MLHQSPHETSSSAIDLGGSQIIMLYDTACGHCFSCMLFNCNQ